MKQRISQESKVLFSLIANALFETNAEIDESSVCYDIVLKEARKQTVEGIIFDCLPSTLKNTNPALYSHWYKRVLGILSDGYRVEKAHGEIGQLLNSNGIKYCLLKGCRSAYYYPDPFSRALGDVDFLIFPKDVDKVCEILKEKGFEQIEEETENDMHIAFIKDKVYYELHYKFDDAMELTESLIENTEDFLLSDGKYTVKVNNEAYHAIVMLLHMKRHMSQAGMGIRHLCDWAVFVNSFDNDRFIKEILPLIESKGLLKFAQALSLASNKYLGLPYREWFGKFDEKIIDTLMDYIFTTGNFGKKEVSFAPFISKNTEIGTSNRFIQFRESLRKIVYKNWPKSKNNKIIFAVGFVYFPIRYFIKSLLGKRKKINVGKAIREGSKINEVFRQLDFYK